MTGYGNFWKIFSVRKGDKRVIKMTVYVKVKALSKRQPLIDRVSFELPENITDSRSLIEYIVRRNVEEYNAKGVDAQLLPYLTSDDILDKEKTGKTGFGDRKNENRQNDADAVKNALLCFEDGIFRLFINDTEIGIDEEIALKNGDEITFVRLTMLAGRKW